MQEDTKEKPLPIIYDGKPLKQAYRADFPGITGDIKARHAPFVWFVCESGPGDRPRRPYGCAG